MKAIKGIVFDFGGVISAAHDVTFWEKAKALTGWSREEIWAGWRRHRWMLDADFVTAQGLYYLIEQDLGKTLDGKTLDALAEMDYDSWAVPNPETLAWAKELKAAGFKIGILTNMPTNFIPWFNRAAAGFKIGILTNMPTNFIPWFNRAAAEFRALADAEVISGAEHIVKPDPAIYALMAQRLALPPEALCFFDDMLPNVEAAQRCGWHAVQFTSATAAREALTALLS